MLKYYRSQEPKQIVVNNETPLTYWCSVLECDFEDLLYALDTIGNSYDAVNIFLQLSRDDKTGEDY